MQKDTTTTQQLGSDMMTFKHFGGRDAVEFELADNPNINTIKNTVYNAVKDIKKDTKENIILELRAMILDKGLWVTKDFDKEFGVVAAKIKKATRHIAEADDSYLKKSADTIIKHYIEEYKLSLAMDKAYEQQDKAAEANSNAYRPKIGKTKINQIALDKVALDDTISKNARMYKLKQMGADTKMIAELMNLKPARVRNGIRTETKKLES